jgi:hypothetical protein
MAGPIDSKPPRRRYYSERTGSAPPRVGLDLDELKRFFVSAYKSMVADGLFQEWFGDVCVDRGEIEGRAGGDMPLYVYGKLRQNGIWPFQTNIYVCDQDELFDVIEFLFDHASEGVDGHHHQFNDCGWHYNRFDKVKGQATFRDAMNEILPDYDSGFELSPEGEIIAQAEEGMDPLLGAPLPSTDLKNVNARVDAAVLKFRRRSSTGGDRRDAVRDLADVLEYLREEAKRVLNRDDERDLFNLANNFGIRHHNQGQKTDYDQAIWHSWMFYHYLATIHACVRLIDKAKASPANGGDVETDSHLK